MCFAPPPLSQGRMRPFFEPSPIFSCPSSLLRCNATPIKIYCIHLSPLLPYETVGWKSHFLCPENTVQWVTWANSSNFARKKEFSFFWGKGMGCRRIAVRSGGRGRKVIHPRFCRYERTGCCQLGDSYPYYPLPFPPFSPISSRLYFLILLLLVYVFWPSSSPMARHSPTPGDAVISLFRKLILTKIGDSRSPPAFWKRRNWAQCDQDFRPQKARDWV